MGGIRLSIPWRIKMIMRRRPVEPACLIPQSYGGGRRWESVETALIFHSSDLYMIPSGQGGSTGSPRLSPLTSHALDILLMPR